MSCMLLSNAASCEASPASFASSQTAPIPQTGSSVDHFPAADVARARLLLSGYHGLPDRDVLTQSPNAFEIVRALSQSSDSLVRDRALQALSRFWPSGDVFLAYANVLADPNTAEGTRHRVMLLAADVFADRAVPMIRPYLEADDVQLRLSAVEALGRVRTDEVVAILTARAEVETDPVVLERIELASRVLR